MPNVKKTELIQLVVYIPSSVSHEDHGSPHFDFIGWLAFYRFATPGVEGSDNAAIRLDMENEPQSDAFLRIAPRCGGQSRNAASTRQGRPN